MKQHIFKILMVTVIGFGLSGCLGSLCNAALGTKKTITTDIAANTTDKNPAISAANDLVITKSDICK